MGTVLAESVPGPSITFERTGATATIEIADSPIARARGLQRRKAISKDHGLLFVIDGPAMDRAIWMRNVRFPIDAIFILQTGDRVGRVVGILRDIPPMNDSPRRANTPSNLILETGATFVERHGIRIGDVVQFQL